MREFADQSGERWVASVREEPGTDYKGRFYLVMSPASGGHERPLIDVRWNTERTARRALETASVVELRRRLRSANGRAPVPARP